MTVELAADNNDWSNKFWNNFCGMKEELSDIDEVDGSGGDILKPLLKLNFLKILFIDIGISLGDVLTDLAQGINLIFDHNWNIQWSTFHYGLVVLVLVWLPLLPLAIHMMSINRASRYYKTENKVQKVLVVAASVIFFPLVPTFMYIKILMMKRNFTTNRNKLKFLEFEDKTTELKALVGSIESPLQFILMLWLMFRGILTLPWDQPLSSSCVEDSLGRVACLPSIPMLSMLFSLLSIIKSVFDLNMFAVSSASVGSLTRSKVCQHLVLCFFPFYLCNILFRLPAYAFILCFIDIWSMIPAVILFILQLALCGLFFIRQESEDQDLPMDDLMVGSYGTINEASTDDEGRHDQVDGPPGLVWDGEQWISRSVMGNTKQRLSLDKYSIEEKYTTEGTEKSNRVEVEESETNVKNFINDVNTPVFINAVAGCFFPCVYTMATRQRGFTLKEMNDLVLWKMKVMKFQGFLFNVGILIVLLTIFILVTSVQSFNYKTNIFSFFWFCAINCYFLILGVTVTFWSAVIYPRGRFPLFQEKVIGAGKEMVEPRVKRNHLTGESNTESLYSARTMTSQEDAGPANNQDKRIYCFLVTFLVLLPSLLGILVYSLAPSTLIYAVQVNQSSTKVFSHVIGSYDSPGFQLQSFQEILIQNFSLMPEDSIGRNNLDGNNSLLYIDQSIEDHWRTSSPKNRLGPQGNKIIKIRQIDFDLAPLDLSREIGLTRSLKDLSTLTQQLTACSDSSVIHIMETEDQRSLQADKKYLFDNGSVIEMKTIAWKCYVDGHPCNLMLESEEQQTGILCGGEETGEQISFEDSGRPILEHDTKLLNGKISSHCCHNASHIIRFYGHQCDNLQLIYLHKICRFSHYFDEGTCGFNGVQTRTQICKVYGLNCVLKRSFQVFCRTQLPLEGCLLDEFSCA